jgi:hypothetical protein
MRNQQLYEKQGNILSFFVRTVADKYLLVGRNIFKPDMCAGIFFKKENLCGKVVDFPD